MVHGGPDYGIYTPKTTIISIEDLGELAVRLGSIVNFDRKGDVLWFDDFEDGISKWEKGGVATRGNIEWSAVHSHNKGFSALLTTGNIDGDLATISHYLPVPVLSKIGFEISFTIDEDTLNATALFLLYDGTYKHDAGVRYVRASETWQYYHATLGWKDLSPTVYLYPGDYHFHTVKLVVDFSTGYYSHLKVNDTLFDLSSYLYKKTTPPLLETFFPYFTIVNNAAVAASSYVDNVILTQNEP